MMTKLEKAAKQALSKLQSAQMCHPNAVLFLVDEAITALRQALEQPAQCPKCKGLGYYDEGHENEDGSMSGGNYVECEKCKAPAQQEHEHMVSEGRAIKLAMAVANDMRIEALKAQQEPVAWAENDGEGGVLWDKESCFSDDPYWLNNPMPLYTRPQAREPLTDEQEREAFEAWCYSVGLMQQSHGIVSISSHTDTAWKSWQARAAHGIGEKK